MASVLFATLVLVAVLVALRLWSKRLQIPAPFLLFPAGILLEFIPGFPKIVLNPEVVLLILLPPLVYAGVALGSWSDFRANLRPISFLAIGVVLITTVFVAVLAHALIPGFSWPVSFALGAIISPPDDVAALAIAKNLGIPRRLVAILEGEGLVNDATALTVLRFAVAAILTGTFSFWKAGAAFISVLVCEIAYGFAVAWSMRKLRSWAREVSAEVALSLLTPFIAFLPAYLLGGSGVLAAVTAGFYISWNAPRLINSETRLQVVPVWQTINFLIEGLLFLLAGLQMRGILSQVRQFSPLTLAAYGALFSLAVIAARFLSNFFTMLLRKFFLPKSMCPTCLLLPWRHVFIISWAGIRGAVSLAAALILPLALPNGMPFPARSLIIYITFCVIVATMFVQGLSLPWLTRRLGVNKDGAAERKQARIEEEKARLQAANAAKNHLQQVIASKEHEPEVAMRLQDQYDYRIRQLSTHLDGDEDGSTLRRAVQELDLGLKVIQEERAEILRLRENNMISNEALRRIERDLDLQEMRLKQGIFQWEVE